MILRSDKEKGDAVFAVIILAFARFPPSDSQRIDPVFPGEILSEDENCEP
jgi:hypothetical protein